MLRSQSGREPFWQGAGRSSSWLSLHSCWLWVCYENPLLSSTLKDPWAMSVQHCSQYPKVLRKKWKTEEKKIFWYTGLHPALWDLFKWVILYLTNANHLSPLSPTSFLVHSMAFWMLSWLVTSSRTVFKYGPATLFRSSAPFSVRQPANTRKPLRSSFLHSRLPNPESQPVTKTYFSAMFSISRLSLNSHTIIHNTTKVAVTYNHTFSL